MSKILRLETIDIDDLEDVPVFEPEEPRVPAIRGEDEGKGEYTFVCYDEDCNFPIFKDIQKGAIRGVAAQCGKCGKYSYLP